jgi:hypothetical protein
MNDQSAGKEFRRMSIQIERPKEDLRGLKAAGGASGGSLGVPWRVMLVASYFFAAVTFALVALSYL